MDIKEKYALGVQNLMDLIPESTVAKQIEVLMDENEGEVINRQIRWLVGDYVVYSGLHEVYSVGTSDSEIFEFCLSAKDYKKFVVACEARRAQMHKQLRSQKKK